MSGRTGRLGVHDEGTVILIARNIIELQKAREYTNPDLDPINSFLFWFFGLCMAASKRRP